MIDLLKKMIVESRKEVGGAYVFGARCEKCTPDARKKYAKRFPAHASIVNGCQVLTGQSATCSGCRYRGKVISDCRGFTAEMWKRASGYMIRGAGCTSQWNNNNNWRDKGLIDDLPSGPCILFNRDANKPGVMAHTGIYDGNGRVIQCGGYGGRGIHDNPIRLKHWTHWAMPVNGSKMQNKGGESEMILELGSRGERVKMLQKGLKEIGYNLGSFGKAKNGVDGIFGTMTLNAVKDFQKKNGLTVSGVWGSAEENKMKPGNVVPGDEFYWVTIRVNEVGKKELLRLYPDALVVKI